MIREMPICYNAKEYPIAILYDKTLSNFKVVLGKSTTNIDQWIRENAVDLWEEFFHEKPLYEINYEMAYNIKACYLPYDGRTSLSDEEQKAIRSLSLQGINFTLEMLWVFVEHLGWRPGMLRQGVFPSKEEIETLYKWVFNYHDPVDWLETGFMYLLLNVEGKPVAINSNLPVKVDLNLQCEYCGRPLILYIENLNRNPGIINIRCGSTSRRCRTPQAFFCNKVLDCQ